MKEAFDQDNLSELIHYTSGKKCVISRSSVESMPSYLAASSSETPWDDANSPEERPLHHGFERIYYDKTNIYRLKPGTGKTLVNAAQMRNAKQEL
jgi:hypothetical protein